MGAELKSSTWRTECAPPAKSSAFCSDADSEPNNDIASATPVNKFGTVISGWQICYAGDTDYYGLDLDAGQQVEVTVRFLHADGDLEAAFLDPEGSVLLESRSEGDFESLRAKATKTGRHFFVVRGFREATGPYDFNIQVPF